jgi:hypothetical protein
MVSCGDVMCVCVRVYVCVCTCVRSIFTHTLRDVRTCVRVCVYVCSYNHILRHLLLRITIPAAKRRLTLNHKP